MTDTRDSGDRLLDQADALIRRHRSFVASPARMLEPTPIPAPTQTLAPLPGFSSEQTSDIDADIPVLTEVIDDADLRASTAEEVIGLALTDQQIATHAAIERWIDESLPDAIMHVLDGFTDRLIAAVSERARAELFASLERDAYGKNDRVGAANE